ncbi:MAG TPA: fused MFS/spermidine synthase [Longimicrobiaceae bacterium]|nr:fused MFS/spermidine synthase [Longimicrobiaceae bacterium]
MPSSVNPTPVAGTAGPALPRAAAPARPRGLVLLATYTTAVFLSAFLLFLVQPMFGRMVLPLLGGTPAVWNTCMLFFQAALLGGYLYAHLTSRRWGVRRQAALHLALLAAAALALPVSVAGAAPGGAEAPIPWLLLLMAGTVGPPFLVLSGTGPILQRWFAHSGHPRAANPYPLYAASNLGSMLALLAYPLWLEPRLRLAGQSAAWTLGYGALVLLLAGCAAWVWRGALPAAAPGAAEEAAAPPTARERAVWTGLAFVPSSLLLGVTTYITTDLTPAPLLWVLPLALYLLSFTLVFARRPPLPHAWMVAAQPSLLVVVALMLLGDFVRRAGVAIPLHLLGLFATALVCHGELARRRPAAAHLTDFYLWIAVGGVLGGVFNVLLAPVLFPDLWEYPLVLALASLARPWPEGRMRPVQHAGAALGAAALALALLALDAQRDSMPFPAYLAVGGALVSLISLGLGGTPPWLAACIGAVLAVNTALERRQEGILLADRGFFGHFKVMHREGRNGGFHVLQHGSTLHGAQSLDPVRRREPLTYYIRFGPLGRVFAALSAPPGERRVAVVGLGTGTTAAYGHPGEAWTFYEIDPGIERVARRSGLFTYLRDTRAEVRVVLGDARLSLARERDRRYDLIVLDAFSSDAIPVHLLTREALGVYLSRLAPGGIIAVHISNRYLDLESVVGALARERGLAARVGGGPRSGLARYENNSSWVVVARTERDLGEMATSELWRRPRLRPGAAPWTDDHAPLLGVLTL